MENVKGKKTIYADISLIICTIIWGTGFVATKVALKYVTPFYMMAIRFGVSSILMSMIFWKRIKTIEKRDIKAGVIIGVFLFSGFALQTVGAQYTNVSKQAFLTATYVVMVPFIYWAVKGKKPDYFDVIAVILSLVGTAFLTLGGELKLGVGDGLTIACALFFAGHIVSIGFFIDKHDAIILTILPLATAFILSTIAALAFEKIPVAITEGGFLSTLYLAVFSTLIAFMIQTMAQKYTSTTHTAIILSLESVFGSIFPIIFLGEVFTKKMVLGCLIIFIAIITAETKWRFLFKYKIRK